MSLIRLRGIAKVYDLGLTRVTALKGVDLEVKEHEFVTVMGASGSGKSTLMNIIGCLDRPSDGVYELDGRDVSRLSDAELAVIRNRQVGFVFPTFNLLPRVPSWRNVELPLVYARVPAAERRARSLAALARVELAERALHRPNELSGGQRQREAIARALVNTPGIIFADEPTGNLDSRTGLSIMALFQRLHAEGATIIMVTHEMDIALHARRIIYLKDGRITGDERIRKPKRADRELARVANLDEDELTEAIEKHS